MTLSGELSAKLVTLGISDDHLRACKLPLQNEVTDLVQAEDDMFGRAQYMTTATLHHWREMKQAAMKDGIQLVLVSAFRSIDYQCTLIANKIDRGQHIDDILSVNAIPGFSEHHTGRALDINCTGCEPLSEAFELTDAFTWLNRHANAFQFTMSYPRDNPAGIIYEPWHWTCHAGQETNN